MRVKAVELDVSYVQKLKRVLPLSIHSYLGAVRREFRSLALRTSRQKLHLLEDPTLDQKERELLRQVESKISPGDGMYTGNGAHYFKVGLSAIRCIEEAIDSSELTSVRRILDLPCGHGRVLRFMIRRFPEAKFTASDLDREGLDFCGRAFHADTVYSELDLTQSSLGQQFDLIWCGSLVTHLDAAGIRALLAFFARHLLPRGLLIFTAHGERVIRRMIDRDFEYGIPQSIIPSIIGAYRKDGFGFADYPGSSGYGISLTSPEWIRGEAENQSLREVYFREHGWDDHQDVYGFVKAQLARPSTNQ